MKQLKHVSSTEETEIVTLSLVNLISHYWLSVFPYIELIGSIANIRASPSP